MAPRANWKGYLRLSLVSCPIALYPASSLSEKISFNRLNRKTGNRLKQQNVDTETGDVVRRDDIARGYEVAKGQYLVVEDEELDAVSDRKHPHHRHRSIRSEKRDRRALH
jgi:DNA end-binding protein Ku